MRLPALTLIFCAASISALIALAESKDAQSIVPGANGKIAFVSARQGPELDVYVMEANGNNETDIFVDPQFFEATVSWSPDGTRLAFGRYDRPLTASNVWIIDAEGSNLAQITFNGYSVNPSWSPDGQALAFEGFPVDHYQVERINLNGTGEINLSNNEYNDEFPSWSPDGTKIAFSSDRNGQEEVYVMDAVDGGNQTRLTFSSSNEWNPRWSPDGTRIAYSSDAFGDEEIHVMDAADGGNDLQLTNNDVDDRHPTFSPDGSLIAYASWVNDVSQIFTMSAVDGSNQTQRTDAPVSNFAPDWQRVEPAPTPIPTLANNVMGNTDCANGVSGEDMLHEIAHVGQIKALTCPENADVDCDGMITLLDALGIGRWLAGLGAPPVPSACRAIGET